MYFHKKPIDQPAGGIRGAFTIRIAYETSLTRADENVQDRAGVPRTGGNAYSTIQSQWCETTSSPFGNMLILLVERCIFIRTQSTATGSDGAVQFEANPEAWSDLQFEPNPRRVRWPAGWRIARQAPRHAKKPCNSNPIAVARSGGDTSRIAYETSLTRAEEHGRE